MGPWEGVETCKGDRHERPVSMREEESGVRRGEEQRGEELRGEKLRGEEQKGEEQRGEEQKGEDRG